MRSFGGSAALVPFLAGPAVRLFLTSTTLLFAELLVIRWIPANVVYVGFFSNFILISSFLGIGLGILLGRARMRLPMSPFTLYLLALVAVVLGAQLNLQVQPGEQIFYGLEFNRSADANFLVLPLLMAAVVALMATLAAPLSGLFMSMPPLRAYSIDIGGSLMGIAAFALISAAGLEPIAWFSILAVLLALLALGKPITLWFAVPATAMALVLVFVGTAGRDVWSPYYRITAYDAAGQPVSARTDSPGIPQYLFVSGIPHQQMDPAEAAETNNLQGQVYRWLPDRTFDHVLIIGAGSGTDTALALRRGAGHVDAVEIDPVIARIGRDFHPDRPYADPRVTVHIDDGRAFLGKSSERYDLIVFALTDSLTLVTNTANVRLESFLYTKESLAAVRDHLDSDGVFVMYNLYREPWLVSKLDTMATEVFGSAPLLRLHGPAEAVLAHGPGVEQARAAGTVADRVDELASVEGAAPTVATDDWPFIYLRNPSIATYYLVALAVLLGFALVAVAAAARVIQVPLRTGFSPHFFILGIAFLLLETRSLVTFSLLFGTTWSVNALAFFAILLSVLVAIGLSAQFPVRRPAWLYGGLFASLALAWLLPPEQLLIDPPALRYTLASALAFAPIVFANLIFAHSFRDTTKADLSFASNLLGAMVGGALEYVALVSGYQALLLLVAGLYALAYLFARRWRLLGDRELIAEVKVPGERAAEPIRTAYRPAPMGRSAKLVIAGALFVFVVTTGACGSRQPGVAGGGSQAPSSTAAVATPGATPVPTPEPTDLELTYTCGGHAFSPTIFNEPAFDLRSSPAGMALAEFIESGQEGEQILPRGGFRLAGQDDTNATFVAPLPGDPPYADAHLENDGSGWRVSGWGQCRPEVVIEGANTATWVVAPEQVIDPASRTFLADVTERECASGRSSEGRVREPLIIYEPDRVVVIFTVDPLPGGLFNCPSNPWTRVRVELSEPLGDRELMDGGLFPYLDPTKPAPWQL